MEERCVGRTALKFNLYLLETPLGQVVARSGWNVNDGVATPVGSIRNVPPPITLYRSWEM